MKFKVKSKDLLDELHLLQGIVERKTTIPILSNILIRVSEGLINLEATDLEVSLTCSVQADAGEEGEATVNARKIYDLVRSLEDMPLEIQMIDNKDLRISGENVDYRIPVLPAEEYPTVQHVEIDDAIELDKDLIGNGISKTLVASAVDDTRYTLNSVLMRLSSDELKFVATDAHRLALCNVNQKVNYSGDKKDFIIPRKAAQELSNLIREQDKDDKLLFKFEENNLFFKLHDRLLMTRIIEGNYPEYEKVIPIDNDVKITVDREVFTKAINRIDLVASEKSHAVVMLFEGSKATLSTSSTEFGAGEELIEVSHGGEKLEIMFNARYLIDFLNSTTVKKVDLTFKDPKTAAILREHENEDYMYVVSPIKM